MEYNKPPLTHQQQLDLWKRRGLLVPDEARAIKYLTNVSYYRLSAYALPFQKQKDKSDKQLIAKQFGVHHTVFSSWIHTLTHIRNICGHHGRLWNREIAIEPQWLQKPTLPWLSAEFEGVRNRSFYAISIIKYLLQTANPSHKIRENLVDVCNKYPDVPIQYMGIPTIDGTTQIDWKSQNLWKQ